MSRDRVDSAAHALIDLLLQPPHRDLFLNRLEREARESLTYHERWAVAAEYRRELGDVDALARDAIARRLYRLHARRIEERS